MALDQLMRFDMDGKTGWGIFELLMGGKGYRRYPNWAAMDMSAFTQDKTPVDRSLEAWLHDRVPDADEVRVEGLDRVDFGHSAELTVLTLVERRGADESRRDLVLRQRPKPPALLEPYDLPRQFEILHALAGTDVRVHAVDLDATGLRTLDTGDHLHRELDHWAAEMTRVKRVPLPALERLLAELQTTMPRPYPTVTLVHGDAKPWMQPVGIAGHPAALGIDELLAHFEKVSGITLQNGRGTALSTRTRWPSSA